MARVETRPYDAAHYLKSERECALYLQAVIDESDADPESIVTALGEIARARGTMQLSRDVGLSARSLAKALSPGGDPSFATVLKICKSLGMKLQAVSGSA